MPDTLIFGKVKDTIGKSVQGGLKGSDPLVLEYTNEAQEMLIRESQPRALFLGGVDQLPLPILEGGVFLLPTTHEAALQSEILTAQDINSGWYNVLDLAGLLDPDQSNDVLMLGGEEVSPGGERKYFVPDAPVGSTVLVMATKRFVAATGDDSVLLVRNLQAIKYAVTSLTKAYKNDDFAGSQDYAAKATASMKADLDRYLMDPLHANARKQAYLNDRDKLPGGTMGQIRGRLALDLPNALKISKRQVTHGLIRAVECLVERTNELRTSGRYGVKDGLSNIVYTPPTQATDPLPITDYEQIRSMCMFFLSQDANPEFEKRAYDLLEGQVNLQLETLRHTTYTQAVQVYEDADRTNVFGYIVAKLQMDGSPDGLMVSDAEMRRYVSQAIREANAQYNNLIRTEDGQQEERFLLGALTDDYVVPYSYETISLLVSAQRSYAAKDKAAGDDAKQQAFGFIARDLATELEATRRAHWQRLERELPRYTFGHMRAKIGLGLPAGTTIADSHIARMLNDAEETLSRTTSYIHGEQEIVVTTVGGMIELPPDVERIIYADVCGFPVETMHRSFAYIGRPGGNGVQPNLLTNWGFFSGFGWRGAAQLQDKGLSQAGNRLYYYNGTPATYSQTEGYATACETTLTLIVKRRWVPKRQDNELMLVQNAAALKYTVESELARIGKDLASAQALTAAAAVELDRALADYNGAATMVPKISFPGQRNRSRMGLIRR